MPLLMFSDLLDAFRGIPLCSRGGISPPEPCSVAWSMGQETPSVGDLLLCVGRSRENSRCSMAMFPVITNQFTFLQPSGVFLWLFSVPILRFTVVLSTEEQGKMDLYHLICTKSLCMSLFQLSVFSLYFLLFCFYVSDYFYSLPD